MVYTIVPNRSTTTQVRTAIRAAWLVGAMLVWTVFRAPVLPSIPDVLLRWPVLLTGGLIPAITTSLTLTIEALIISTLIALPLAYASRIPEFAPVGRGLSQLRFLSPASFYIVLVFALQGGHAVKLWMLVLSETFYLVTTMTNVIQNIPDDAFDEARVLRMSEWQALYYVAVRGTLAEALEAIRDNAAIGWSMLMMVEGIVRSEGGVGVMLFNLQDRRMDYTAGFAIIATIGVVGILQDYLLRAVRSEACPYTK